MKLSVLGSSILLALSTMAYSDSHLSPIPNEIAENNNLQTQTVVSGIEFPWGLSWLPDGTAFIATKPGALLHVSSDGSTNEVDGVPEVFYNRQGGLFEVMPHPQFEENQWVYLSYAWGTADANGLRIARAKFDAGTLSDLEVLFTVSPLKEGGAHYGGRMTFLPDGTLVFGSGEGYEYREDAQKLDSLMGKVIRINADGSIPADNPFVGNDSAHDAIWSYGHRNPQGVLFDTQYNRLYVTEHGPKGGDEINIIQPGANYGWPAITYGTEYSGAQITPHTALPGMEQPFYYYVPSIAPAGFAQVSGEVFASWEGDLLLSALSGKELRRVDMEGGEVVGQERLLTDLSERFRDVRMGPDGAIYVLTDSSDGRLIKLTPAD